MANIIRKEKYVNLSKSVSIKFNGNEISIYEDTVPIGQWGVVDVVHISEKEFFKMCTAGMKYYGKTVKK